MTKALSVAELMNVFKSLDVNGDGIVTRSELSATLCQAGLPPKNVEKLMSQLDLNGDGQITINEYKIALGLTNEPMAEWKRLFAQIDADKSGEVDAAELHILFDQMGISMSRKVLEDWISDYDVDGNGKLSYKEFIGFVASNLSE